MTKTIMIFLFFSLLLKHECMDLPADFKIAEKQKITINLPSGTLANKKNKLAFSARMQLDKQKTGATPALRVEVNGVIVNDMRLVNKGHFFHFSEWSYPWFNSKYNAFLVPYYAWDYPDKLPDGPFVFDFVLDISSFLKESNNQLVISNTFDFPWLKNATIEIKGLRLAGDGEFKISKTIKETPRCSRGLWPLRYSATGAHCGISKKLSTSDDFESASPLPAVVSPKLNIDTLYNLRSELETLKLSVSDVETELKTIYKIASSNKANSICIRNDSEEVIDSASNLKIKRQIIKKNGWVEIHDELTNLTKLDLPVILDYQFKIHLDKLKEFRMAGKKQAAFYANTDNMDLRYYAMTPLVFLGFEKGGLGIYIEDKVFRNQHSIIAVNDTLHIADDMFYLAPEKSYTVVLKLYPVQDGDYYKVLNTLRYDYSLYQNIPYLFGFVYENLKGGYFEKSIKFNNSKEIKAFFDDTGIGVAGIMPMYNEPKNPAQYGANYGAEPMASIKKRMSSYLNFINSCRNAGVKTHFIAYIDTHLVAVNNNGKILEGEEKFTDYYADSLSYSEFDKLVPYSNGKWLYNVTPAFNNRAGKMVFETMNYYLGEAGFDGIFFDEFNHSKVRTDFRRHDGYTALLDQNGNIKEKIAIVPLYSEKYLLTLAEQALKKSKVVYANEFDCTVDLMRTPLIHFAEPHIQEDDYFVRAAQAGRTPLTLSTTWKSYTSAWSDTKYFLRYGVLTCFYGNRMTGEHVLKKVYPITVKEIYPGLVIGDDKIVTSRSGTYTLGRNKKLSALVYGDPSGLLQKTLTSYKGEEGKEYIFISIDQSKQIAVIIETNE